MVIFDNGVVCILFGFVDGFVVIVDGGWIGINVYLDNGGMGLLLILVIVVNDMMVSSCLVL